MAQTGAERPSQLICVHYCVPTVAGRSNSVHKCPNSAPRDPRNQSVYTIASMRPSRQRDSVHKWLKLAPHGSYHQSVYTIASPRLLAVATVYTNAPKRCQEVLTTDLCTLLRPEAAHHPRATTVYTNGPIRRREVLATNLCTLLRPPFTHNVRFSSRASVPQLFAAMRYRVACLAGGLSRWGRGNNPDERALCVGVPWHCTSPLPVPLEVFAMESRSRFA